MSRTQIDGISQIESGSITRSDLNTTTTGLAVITAIIPGTGITLSQTGIDPGTGDVTINSSPFTGGILTSPATMMVGTISSAPLLFQSGANLTTPITGAMEFDGTNLYFTPMTVRQTVAIQTWVTATASQLAIVNAIIFG